MAKQKKKSVNVLKAKKKKQPKKDPNVEEVREEVVWFNCPVKGRVSQKVKIKKYKTPSIESQKHVLDSKDPLDSIDGDEDSLSIYHGDDLGIEDKE